MCDGKESTLQVAEDNDAARIMVSTGKNQKIRHLSRTHRVNLAWLFELARSDTLNIKYRDTKRQAGDIFTKGFTNPQKWWHATFNISHVFPSEFWTEYSTPSESPAASAAIAAVRALPTCNYKFTEYCCKSTSVLSRFAPADFLRDTNN